VAGGAEEAGGAEGGAVVSATKKPAWSQSFAHAADLPAAYGELAEAITALVKLQECGPVPFLAEDARRVTELAPSAMWQDADAKIAAWQRLGAAARRVEIAKNGPARARRTVGFSRTEVRS
jgi:hypothetical protein